MVPPKGMFRWWLLGLLGLLVVQLAAPSAAWAGEATWSSLGTVSVPGRNSFSPQVAVAPTGDAALAWELDDGTRQLRIQDRFRSVPTGHLSGGAPPELLSDPGQDAHAPQVAIAPNGDAVFVWERPDDTNACFGSGCSRIQARVRTATGALSPVETLSDPGQDAHAPQVAIAPDGDAVFVWERLDGLSLCSGLGCSRIEARARRATGSLRQVETLSDPGQDAHAPQVAIAPNGDAVFVWQRTDGTSRCSGSACSRIEARARAATGDLSPVETLSGKGHQAQAPQVGVDSEGDAVFAWERLDATSQCSGSGCSRIQTLARTATGALSSVQTLSDPGQDAHAPQVGVALNGNAVFVWERLDDTTDCSGSGCSRIQARARTAGGSLSGIQTLSAPGQHARAPQVGVDSGGRAAFVWQAFDGTNTRIYARSRTATGPLSPVQILSDAGQEAFTPALAVDPDGGLDPSKPDAIAVWSRFDGTRPDRPCCLRIQAAEQTVVSTTAQRFESTSWEMSRSWDQGTVIADFNGDGLDDFLFTRHNITNEDYTLLQQPDGSFARGFTFPPGKDRHGCAAGDVNGDQLVDIYCVRGAHRGTELKKNELWIAQPNGTYVNQGALWGVTDPSGRGRRPLFFDFNDDGRLDLYVTNFSEPRPDGRRNENILYLNAGGAFVERRVTATGSWGSTCAEAGDWDDDGLLDLLVCGGELHLFGNVGGQDTELADNLLGPEPVAWPRHATLSDVNSDGMLDLIIVTQTELQIRLNLGGGARFSAIYLRMRLADGMAAAVGDVTGDDVPDIYVVQGFANGRNAKDLLLEGPAWLPVGLPQAYRGWGSTAEIIDVSGRPKVLVTNGHEQSSGPVQFIGLRP